MVPEVKETPILLLVQSAQVDCMICARGFSTSDADLTDTGRSCAAIHEPTRLLAERREEGWRTYSEQLAVCFQICSVYLSTGWLALCVSLAGRLAGLTH